MMTIFNMNNLDDRTSMMFSLVNLKTLLQINKQLLVLLATAQLDVTFVDLTFQVQVPRLSSHLRM